MIRTVQEASQLAVNVERWIAEARGGDRAALERLLEAFFPYLLAVAQREFCAALRSRLDPSLGSSSSPLSEFCAALRSRLDPMDAVQDTLLKAWQNFLQFRGVTGADFLAWLGQILRHTLANERRKHLQTAMRSIEREVRLVEAAAIPWADDSGSEFGLSGKPTRMMERREALEMALRRLPNRYRQVLNLHSQEEMTFAQVGEHLHCSAEAARKLWRRAAEKLARLLGDAWEPCLQSASDAS